MWFAIWSVLVVGTLVGAFFLGRRLWRSSLALGRELARAGGVLAELGERVDELQDQLAQQRPDVGPTVFADRDVLRGERRRLQEEAAARRAARAEQHASTARGWRRYWT